MKTDTFKIASLDIGSNSFLLLLCEANPTGIVKINKDVVEIVRLGQGLAVSKRFAPEALARARHTLKNFKDLIDVFSPDIVLAKATAAARIAENRSELLEIGKQLGIEIETIPGEQEAKITYQGVSWGQALPPKEYNLLIDIGGGSTELIVGCGSNIVYSVSIPFGAVLLTERFITGYPVSDADEKKLESEIQSGIAKAIQVIQRFPIENIMAVAGTPTTLAQILQGGYEEEKIDGSILTVNTLVTLEKKMKIRTPEQRILEMEIPKGRADVLYAGTMLLKLLTLAVARTEVKVSTRGVRHGIVADYFLSDPKTIK